MKHETPLRDEAELIMEGVIALARRVYRRKCGKNSGCLICHPHLAQTDGYADGNR